MDNFQLTLLLPPQAEGLFEDEDICGVVLTKCLAYLTVQWMPTVEMLHVKLLYRFL